METTGRAPSDFFKYISKFYENEITEETANGVTLSLTLSHTNKYTHSHTVSPVALYGLSVIDIFHFRLTVVKTLSPLQTR